MSTGSRPPGVRARVTSLIDEHRESVSNDPRKAARSRLETFVRLSGRSAFGDVPTFRVLDVFRAARAFPPPAESGFGARLVTCLGDVDAALDGRADGPEETLNRVFTSIPPSVILRAAEPDVHFHLVCVTAARSALDGIDTPYLAVRAWATMRILRPDEDFGITATGERLAIRYEDEPHNRDATDTEIRHELTRYLTAVPFDV